MDDVKEHVLELIEAGNMPNDFLSAEEGVEISRSVKTTLLEQLSARKSEFESLDRASDGRRDPSFPWIKKTIRVRAVATVSLQYRA